MTPEARLAEIKKHWRIPASSYYRRADASSLIAALEAVLAMTTRNGYTTWDSHNVLVNTDGTFDKKEAEEWEMAHGHDIRTKCYPEFGCQLWLDPEEIRIAITEALGVTP